MVAREAWAALKWAEITWEGEVGEVGMAGRSEANGGGGFGVVSSARTTVESGYLQITQVLDGGSAVPCMRFGILDQEGTVEAHGQGSGVVGLVGSSGRGEKAVERKREVGTEEDGG